MIIILCLLLKRVRVWIKCASPFLVVANYQIMVQKDKEEAQKGGVDTHLGILAEKSILSSESVSSPDHVILQLMSHHSIDLWSPLAFSGGLNLSKLLTKSDKW